MPARGDESCETEDVATAISNLWRFVLGIVLQDTLGNHELIDEALAYSYGERRYLIHQERRLLVRATFPNHQVLERVFMVLANVCQTLHQSDAVLEPLEQQIEFLPGQYKLDPARRLPRS